MFYYFTKVFLVRVLQMLYISTYAMWSGKPVRKSLHLTIKTHIHSLQRRLYNRLKKFFFQLHCCTVKVIQLGFDQKMYITKSKCL